MPHFPCRGRKKHLRVFSSLSASSYLQGSVQEKRSLRYCWVKIFLLKSPAAHVVEQQKKGSHFWKAGPDQKREVLIGFPRPEPILESIVCRREHIQFDLVCHMWTEPGLQICRHPLVFSAIPFFFSISVYLISLSSRLHRWRFSRRFIYKLRGTVWAAFSTSCGSFNTGHSPFNTESALCSHNSRDKVTTAVSERVPRPIPILLIIFSILV
ncbi:hypothetical protein RRG08_008019 [Elysia crispata]|uniref:Uncharacterized protein n=1 Tax=Elysia crispata TaxID=231223 RepID=A0AAE0YRR6_9GAST|nr:hypothetical protein RRG08_008019 [Elysia crispata]